MTDNYYVNPSNIHICFPIKILKKSNNSSNIDDHLITVNNFFAHWVKEVSITKYGSNKELPPTFAPWEVYQYSDAMLKHLPKDSLKTLQNHLLYSKEKVYYASTAYDRRNLNGRIPTGVAALSTAKKAIHAKDLNIDKRIELLSDQLQSEFIYRIPLRYFSDIGKINFPTKIDYRIKLFLEMSMNKLFEPKKVLASTVKTAPDPDVEILFTRAPFVQYEQILLDKNFRQHLETIMVSKKIIRMGAQKTPIQKTYEIKHGSDSLNMEFLGANRQFDWIEISIVQDKSDKHTTIYDSYNRELAAQTIKTIKLSNFTEIYSLTNKKNTALTTSHKNFYFTNNLLLGTVMVQE